LYLGYGTKNKTGNITNIYAGNTLKLIIGDSNKVSVTNSAVNINPYLYANNTANISGGLYLSSYKIGTLNNSV